LLNGGANPRIGPAATYVAGHGGIDSGIVGTGITYQKRGCRHDLTRLAIPALHNFKVQPGVLNLLASCGIPDCLNRRDCRFSDALDRGYARAYRLTVEMNCAGSAQRHAASKLGSGQPKDVAQYPEQWCVAVDIDYMIRSIDFDCVRHDHPRVFAAELEETRG
jgi:hypothetical protein